MSSTWDFFQIKHLQQLGGTFILPCAWDYSEIFKTTFWKKISRRCIFFKPCRYQWLHNCLDQNLRMLVMFVTSSSTFRLAKWQWRLFSNFFCLESKNPYLIHRISSIINAYHFIIREWYSTKLSMKHSILMNCRLFPWQVNLGSYFLTILHLPNCTQASFSCWRTEIIFLSIFRWNLETSA